MNTFQPKQVDFKFGVYLDQGFALFKKDIGNFILAMLFVVLMSLIPLCSFLAIGNFMKYCRKVNSGIPASPSEIFNFDDIGAYIKLSLFMIVLGLALMIPYSYMIYNMIILKNDGGSGVVMILMMLFIFAVLFVLYYFTLKGFYIIALFSLGGVKDLKESWTISKVMTKNNLLMILLFSFVISAIAQLGIFLCFIGIFFTLPIAYTCYYFAYEDGLKQISTDEANEANSIKSFQDPGDI